MEVIFKTTEHIPAGFKCTGCKRLKRYKYAAGEKYYCELSGHWCELNKNEIAIKTKDCLLQTREFLINKEE